MALDNGKFPLNSKVRFTEDRLSLLMPMDRKRLENRIGVVQGYWNYTRKPVVYFEEEGGRSELRLLRVDPRHLEQVEESSFQNEIDQIIMRKLEIVKKCRRMIWINYLDNSFIII